MQNKNHLMRKTICGYNTFFLVLFFFLSNTYAEDDNNLFKYIGNAYDMTPEQLKYDQFKSFVFYAEMFGIWVFAIYWLVKSKEISEIKAQNPTMKSTYL